MPSKNTVLMFQNFSFPIDLDLFEKLRLPDFKITFNAECEKMLFSIQSWERLMGTSPLELPPCTPNKTEQSY